jgi:hypothetical protein
VTKRWLVLLSVAALLGFFLGGSFVWSIDYPYRQQYVANPAHEPDTGAEDDQPAKTLRERLSIIWDRTWEEPVAFYTFVLSIFTALLAAVSGFQIWFLIRTDKITRLTADAASLNAKAAINAQLPIIALKLGRLWISDEHGQFYGDVNPRNLLPEYVCPHIVVQNMGSLPAEIVRGCVNLLATTALSPEPVYRNAYSYPPGIMLAFDREVVVEPTNNPFSIAADQRLAISQDREKCWVYGFLDYKDFMGEAHTYRFCLNWRPHGGPNDTGGFFLDENAPPKYTERT